MIDLLPYDILIDEIIARVLQDRGPRAIFQLSCVCKYLEEVTNGPRVLRRISFPLKRGIRTFPISQKSVKGYGLKCAIMGNLRAIVFIAYNYGFRAGVEEDLGERAMFVNEHAYETYLVGVESEKMIVPRFESNLCFRSLFRSNVLDRIKTEAIQYFEVSGVRPSLSFFTTDSEYRGCPCAMARLKHSSDQSCARAC